MDEKYIEIMFKLDQINTKLDNMSINTVKMSEHIDNVEPIIKIALPIIHRMNKMLQYNVNSNLEIENELD